MTQLIAVGTDEEIEVIKQNLSFNNYEVDSNRLKLNMLQSKMASLITDVIINYWEFRFVEQIVRTQYYFFTPEEKEEILNNSRKILESGLETRGIKTVYGKRKREKIMNKVEEYLVTEDEINIKGFVTFRLRDYMRELQEVVDTAVDEFMMEKEYNEFIRLLRYFVDIQEPKLDIVHVVINPDSSFMLYDEVGEELSSTYLESFFMEMAETDVNYDDLLISALITIAPKQIELHFKEKYIETEATKTVEHVFGNRVEKCLNCNKCQEKW
ncbi:putative sporulation protein YtxC [Desulfitispora alkaliphila]|uniref:putative sporulation protein YtxC n=1 Tax=Desulfitispora alkaliphila TaxID=622674 RepID=UPI003D25F389